MEVWLIVIDCVLCLIKKMNNYKYIKVRDFKVYIGNMKFIIYEYRVIGILVFFLMFIC